MASSVTIVHTQSPIIARLGRAMVGDWVCTMRHLRYERVYLPLCEVADTPFHI